MKNIPLFPLNTVLFPGMPLRLHIFEPQYVEMINHCIKEKAPFGVVLIRKGSEAQGSLSDPFPIGTTAQITEVTPVHSGKMDILTIGGKRFRVESINTDKDYLVGQVNEFPIEKDDTDRNIELARGLLPWMHTYLELLAELRDTAFDLSIVPKTPLLTAYLAAVLLQIPLIDKQKLLSFEQMSGMLQELHRIYRREVALLKSLLANHIKSADEFLFPLN